MLTDNNALQIDCAATSDEQLKLRKGYDHNWALRSASGSLRRAAQAYEPKTGRLLEVWTSEPGIQFYSGNFFDGSIRGKGGRAYSHRCGFWLETQHHPDSPNKPNFPSTVLKPGQRYHAATEFRLSTR
jgi:aldose 1-epimerase